MCEETAIRTTDAYKKLNLDARSATVANMLAEKREWLNQWRCPKGLSRSGNIDKNTAKSISRGSKEIKDTIPRANRRWA
jgi:hypothetical protein